MIAQTGNRAVFNARSNALIDQVVTPPAIAPEPLLYTAEVSVVFEVGAAIPAR